MGLRYWALLSEYRDGGAAGELDAVNEIFAAEFDGTGTRLVTGEADNTIKIWKQDKKASELTHPIDMLKWRKCLAETKRWY